MVGLALGLLATVQFLIGTEVLVIAVATAAVGLVLVLAAGLTAREDPAGPPALRPALRGWGPSASAVLLAYPTWFALAGPAHLSGSIWGNGADPQPRGSVPRHFLRAAAPDPRPPPSPTCSGGTRDRSSPRSTSAGGSLAVARHRAGRLAPGPPAVAVRRASAWWRCSCRSGLRLHRVDGVAAGRPPAPGVQHHPVPVRAHRLPLRRGHARHRDGPRLRPGPGSRRPGWRIGPRRRPGGAGPGRHGRGGGAGGRRRRPGAHRLLSVGQPADDRRAGRAARRGSGPWRRACRRRRCCSCSRLRSPTGRAH